MSVAVSPPKACFQFKGGSFTLTVIQLFSTDLNLFSTQLKDKVQQAPRFFYQAPVVIDLQKVSHSEHSIDFKTLANALSENQLCAVGVRGGSAEHMAAAQLVGFALLPEGHSKEERLEPETRPAASAPPREESSSRTPTRLITQPIRSGQQIYARGGDLLVVAPVSAGAELLADGHIHVYGPLRGRALAGVTGDGNARIFCRSLEAELVSIAGHYRVSEDLKENLWRSPVHICLQGELLQINQVE